MDRAGQSHGCLWHYNVGWHDYWNGPSLKCLNDRRDRVHRVLGQHLLLSLCKYPLLTEPIAMPLEQHNVDRVVWYFTGRSYDE